VLGIHHSRRKGEEKGSGGPLPVRGSDPAHTARTVTERGQSAAPWGLLAWARELERGRPPWEGEGTREGDEAWRLAGGHTLRGTRAVCRKGPPSIREGVSDSFARSYRTMRSTSTPSTVLAALGVPYRTAVSSVLYESIGGSFPKQGPALWGKVTQLLSCRRGRRGGADADGKPALRFGHTQGRRFISIVRCRIDGG